MVSRILVFCLVLCAGDHALADDRKDCAAAAGTFLTGVVISGPRFAHGKVRDGVELSHTHVRVRADQDGRVYDVAADNVFASGYDAAAETVPTPLDAIRRGSRVSLCGQLYTRGVGIHFVHTNCGAPPSPSRPNGWLKLLDASEMPGDNLEGATAYCRLWQRQW
jgi:hypothetical protein